MENNKKEIIDLLKSTERPNIDKVINWLNQDPSFFVVPAAKRQHDNVKGGLAYHSLKVYKQAKADWDQQDDNFKNQYPLNSVIISSLLHDVCKKDVYYFDDEGRPQINRTNYDKGHGLRSVKLIEELGFELTNDERMAIWWHMGEGHEVSQPNYPREYNIAMQDPFCQLIHQADKKAADESKKEQTEARLASLDWDARRAKEMIESRRRFVPETARTEVFKHNMTIFKEWKYIAPSGETVNLFGTCQDLLNSTRVYKEEVSAADVPALYKITKKGCANEDCMVVAKNLIDQGLNPAILNMADAYHACGKYNTGANAQEESICRTSTLSLTLYQYFNKTWANKAGVPLRSQAYPMDIHFGGIYSPNVTVFRDNEQTGFALRENPYQTSFISVAALNFKPGHPTNNLEYHANDGGFTEEGKKIMCDKIRTIYRIALLNGHDSLVLGAFGCGVFKLEPEFVAELFKQILDENEFKGKFHTIAFALLEGPAGSKKKVEEEGDMAPFYNKFGRLQ